MLEFPPRDILLRAQQSHPGQVIEAELDEDDDVFVDELKYFNRRRARD